MEENALESLIVLNNDIYRDLQKVKASLSDAENFGSVTNFVGFRVPNVSLSTSIEDL